jgi:hypothetical protein
LDDAVDMIVVPRVRKADQLSLEDLKPRRGPGQEIAASLKSSGLSFHPCSFIQARNNGQVLVVSVRIGPELLQ